MHICIDMIGIMLLRSAGLDLPKQEIVYGFGAVEI